MLWVISKRVSVVLGLGLVFQSSLISSAQVVSFQFAGQLNTLSDPGHNLPSDITSSSTFTGAIIYDTTGVADSPDPVEGFYTYTTASPSFSMTLSIEGDTITSVITPPNNGNNHVLIDHNFGGGTSDEVQYAAQYPNLNGSPLPASPASAQLDIFLANSSGNVFASSGIPRSVPNLSSFPDFHVLEFSTKDGANHDLYFFDGVLTSITPVPEPASATAAIGFGLLAFAGIRSRRNRS